MKKEIIKTENAPAAIGPYSQGIAVGASEICYLSGQIAIDPETGKPIGGNAAEQTKQIFKNISALLSERSMKTENIVKTTVFITDMKDFADVNAEYGKHFLTAPPARSCVQVAALPLNSAVEIEVIACK
ncbi:MAG: RidA family protein [Clostridia bacterium]|jgi:2-iminobutanoate/2-iminopropanoate deaminase|nr:RidA family protein [Clostridia bacterium]